MVLELEVLHGLGLSSLGLGAPSLGPGPFLTPESFGKFTDYSVC